MRGAEHVDRRVPAPCAMTGRPSTTRQEERRAFFEKMWNSPGFTKLSSNYSDLLFNAAANAEWCEFIGRKIRDIVKDPRTAERLIPKDHRFGEKRPPFVTGYYEVFNRPHVSLVDLKETPIVRVTETGIETIDGERPVRHRGVGDRLRLRHRRPDPHGDPRPARTSARGALGRWSEDVSRRPDDGLPQLLLPRWTARGGREQPALQRRPGRLHRRCDHVCARQRLRHHRGGRLGRGQVDRHGRPGRRRSPLRGDQLLLRQQHPGEAPQVPPQLGGPTEALQGDRTSHGERLQVVPPRARSSDGGDRRQG